MAHSFFKRLQTWIHDLIPHLGLLSPAKATDDCLEVPIIPIAGPVILPGAIQLLHVPETHLHDLLHGYCREKNLVAISDTRAIHTFRNSRDDKRTITVLGEILEVKEQPVPGGLAAQGHSRARIVDFIHGEPLAIALVKPIPETWGGAQISREDAKIRLMQLLDRWAFLKGSDEPALLTPIRDLSADRICDIFGFYGLKDSALKQQVLELTDGEERFLVIERLLVSEISRMEKFPAVEHYPQDGYSIH